MRMAAPKASTKKFDAAVKSMISFGFSKTTVVQELKKLLALYDDSWEHIEADNYTALVEALCPDSEQEGQKKRAENKNLDSDHCNKKLKIKGHVQKTKSIIDGSGKRDSELSRQPKTEALEGRTTGTQLQQNSAQIVIKGPNMETSLADTTTIGENSSALLPESQEHHAFVTPLRVMCPEVLEPSRHNDHKDAHMISSIHHAGAKKFKGVLVVHEEQMDSACNSQGIVSNDLSTNFEVALSNSGLGKLSFSFNPSVSNGSDFHMPNIESVCKAMEARCLKTYRILEPNFSFMKLLDDTCQCILDLGSGSSDTKEQSVIQILSAMSKPSVMQSFHTNQSSSSCMPLNNLMRLGDTVAFSGGNQNNSSNMQDVQFQLSTSVKRQYHYVNDITKGEESVSIPIVSGVEDGVLPPPFQYIPHNTSFQDAYINLSLARIGSDNCCSDCFGDCLAEPLPCPCAIETGGEFAYARDGLLKKEFVDACIALLQEPLKYFDSCSICPDACKGHPVRKFIKECWRKCGCTRNCGNRVVQRGITRSLQASCQFVASFCYLAASKCLYLLVFLTSGEKGWGLRTAERLPRGAFVCEYVGEILTNSELHERNNKKSDQAKHTYPMMLDADWYTEDVLKDDEALCLDATFYGNVARFINHRCLDANIIDIPVEIETPDHHYYHVAFFTAREVEPFEELTWDYGIDFDDVNHPIKAFRCDCGSGFCRDKNRISRGSKSRAKVLRSRDSRQ
ncbi:hypothetical protein U9M48_022731 [Paspalum notatum var. saurae]|uniref:Uncharacterized protein n=1 Tax=Paspalum notatum var. saurae TaxID=547442 RepID=A0AAQ3TIA7_PASNO